MSDSAARQQATPRLDHALIETLVPEGASVLDLGCGDGRLLERLAAHKHSRVYGIEINEEFVLQCINRGIPVYHGDMMEGMSHYTDRTFDLVILSQTLQQTLAPVKVIHEMLRVGGDAIISFPNFGYWRVRSQLMFGGRMPRTKHLPYTWYDTPNVHLCTVTDFRDICAQEGLERVQEVFLVPPERRIGAFWANLRAAVAIFKVRPV